MEKEIRPDNLGAEFTGKEQMSVKKPEDVFEQELFNPEELLADEEMQVDALKLQGGTKKLADALEKISRMTLKI